MPKTGKIKWLAPVDWKAARKSVFLFVNLVLLIPLLFVYWPLIAAFVIGAMKDIRTTHYIPRPQLFLMHWLTTIVFAIFVIFHAVTNFDGQGKTDLYEAVLLNKPFSAFVKYDKFDMLVEESCWYKINKGESHLPSREDDIDQDHFPTPCDRNDTDPSSTPTKLILGSDHSNPSPNNNDRVVPEKDLRFSVRAPHLGKDESIVKVYLFISSDDLSEEDGIFRYYVQQCPPRYDHEQQWKLYCDLNDGIYEWIGYLNLIEEGIYARTDNTRTLKWRMKYLTNKGNVGDVQSHPYWWMQFQTKWNYFEAMSQ